MSIRVTLAFDPIPDMVFAPGQSVDVDLSEFLAITVVDDGKVVVTPPDEVVSEQFVVQVELEEIPDETLDETDFESEEGSEITAVEKTSDKNYQVTVTPTTTTKQEIRLFVKTDRVPNLDNEQSIVSPPILFVPSGQRDTNTFNVTLVFDPIPDMIFAPGQSVNKALSEYLRCTVSESPQVTITPPPTDVSVPFEVEVDLVEKPTTPLTVEDVVIEDVKGEVIEDIDVTEVEQVADTKFSVKVTVPSTERNVKQFVVKLEPDKVRNVSENTGIVSDVITFVPPVLIAPELSLMSAQRLINEALALVNDPGSDLYSDTNMLTYANRALRDISVRAQTLRVTNYREANAGQANYGMPDTTLAVVKASWLYGNDWYPLVKRDLGPIEGINNSDILKSWRPFYYNLWGRGRVEKVVSTVASVFTSSFRSAGGAYGVLPHDILINATDDSEGVVTRVDGANIYFSDLAGGEDNIMSVGDEFRVLSRGVFNHVLRVSPVPSNDSDSGTEVLWVYIVRAHQEITQSHIDAHNDDIELDLELWTCILEYLIYWCRREELGASDPETMAQHTLYQNAYHEVLPFIRDRIRAFESAWGSPSTSGYLRSIELSGIADSDGHPFNNINIY